MKKSWKTTIAGVIAGLILILPQVALLLDGDEDTKPDYNIIVAGLATMGIGINARDFNKSSEDEGIK